MTGTILPRKLWHETVDGREMVEQEALLDMRGPLVILGEAGMGKTLLLRWLGSQSDHAYCTARQLRNARPDGRKFLARASRLVVDALDELSVQSEGDAVDIVLQKLGDTGYPPFVLSCRVADWRSATATVAIREQYDAEVTVLHLEAFTDDEVLTLLAAQLGGDTERAEQVAMHFRDRHLEEILGNPQTLEMAAKVASEGPLPDSKADLFQRAVDILRKEHNNARSDRQPAQSDALDAAGAAFASLILTGSDAVAVGKAEPEEGDLALVEIAALPGGSALEKVIGTRLFSGSASRFSYLHRTIGEFLGARWLAKQADSVLKRQRLHAAFQSRGLVPASLRGLHAWLAHHSPELAPAAIAADPMGVVEYGDADTLNPMLARQLLGSLKDLASDNPRFRDWHRYSLKALVQPALLGDIRSAIHDPTIDFGLRLMLLESVRGAEIARALRPDLRAFVVNGKTPFAVRVRAVDALVLFDDEDWRPVVDGLRRIGDNHSMELALRIIDGVSVRPFDDETVVDIIFSQANREDQVVGLFHGFDSAIVDERLDTLLDRLADRASQLGTRHERVGNNELTDLAYGLIERRLALGDVEPMRLWAWLRPFDDQIGYRREARTRVHELIKENTPVRRAVQRFVLLDEVSDKTVHQRAWRMASRSAGFSVSSEDAAWLLGLLDPASFHHRTWRDLLNLVSHSESEGMEAREAAKDIVRNRADLVAWVDRLTIPRVPTWEKRQERSKRRRSVKQAIRHAEHRAHYLPHIGEMRAGVFEFIINPAKAYLNLFYDMDKSLGPRERVADWLGKDVADAAIAGFECFLDSNEPPTPEQMAESRAKGRVWNSPSVIIAAMHERILDGRGLVGVSDERLIVGYYELDRVRVDEHAKLDGLRSQILSEMTRRNLVERAIRGWIEPQLAARLKHVDQLYPLLRDEKRRELASRLAADWLQSYRKLPAEPEAELIDRLIWSSRFDDLRSILTERIGQRLQGDRRRNWAAIALIADFERHRGWLDNMAKKDGEWLWSIRSRLTSERGRNMASIGLDQLVWIFSTFRNRFPNVEHPRGQSEGHRNKWDASDFLGHVAGRIADFVDTDAMAALSALRDAQTDGYTPMLQYLVAEQRRKYSESAYRPHDFSLVRTIVTAAPPTSVQDLQATMVALIAQIQKRITADPADPWRGFFTDAGTPHDEERCRDHLLTMLGPRPEKIDLLPEGHLADDNRADIIGLIAGMRLPIEIKGQWHAELWRAADTQLDRLYASDYAAERRGIYLVFWFGHDVRDSKKPKSRGRGHKRPTSAEDLRRGLASASLAAADGRVDVIVLDMVRANRK